MNLNSNTDYCIEPPNFICIKFDIKNNDDLKCIDKFLCRETKVNECINNLGICEGIDFLNS